MATTVRCPSCGKRNQVPAGAEGRARCGACRAMLQPGGSPSGAMKGGPGSPWGADGPPSPASPFGGPGGPGASAPWGGLGGMGGGGDPSGARMRQSRNTPRTPSTSATGPSPLGDPGDPRGALMQRWDELLRLAPQDMGLTAAMGGDPQRGADPLAWLSETAGIPREALDEARQVRNYVAAKRSVPDGAVARALGTLDRAIAMLGHRRFPG